MHIFQNQDLKNVVLFVGFAGSPSFLLGKIYTVTRGLADDDLLVLGVALVRVQY